jgi:hypothetical protein
MSAMASRHLALLLALGALLAAGEARAQGSIVTPTPGPSVPGYAPMPPPGGYAPYVMGPPVYYMPVPVRRHNPAMAAGGIALVAVGGVLLVAGTATYAAGAQTTLEFPPCPADVPCNPIETSRHPELRDAGIAMMVGSVAMIAAGIPLIVIGSRRVTDRPEPAQSLLPDLRVGAGGLSARWSF